MNLAARMSTSLLRMCLGAMLSAHAQQERQDPRGPERQAPEHPQKTEGRPPSARERPERTPERQEGRRSQPRPPASPTDAKTLRTPPSEERNRDPRASRDRSTPAPTRVIQPPSRTAAGGSRRSEQRTLWKRHRAASWEVEHRSWKARGGYSGYRIPDDRYRNAFGLEHRFRLYQNPLYLVGGYPRFQYSGFWFSVIDPWPEYWSDEWYDHDEVYIDYYEDGYYLTNRRHPGDRIALSVSLTLN